ncbi:Beta-lactamase class A [Actinokineospora alba]|uniref:Beta-lactamase class A n=1 Tax=Actinokineospora alba TaxID=504798 RepID=A0A1H0JP03_9PSEU|nr:beta-lactamase class A [Actinokineospora alba]SDH94644.1 Beta-lactamase class A [Actinokineospora alba]SDO45303.1 Beta-lactamase class A [Actinokineospora alba]
MTSHVQAAHAACPLPESGFDCDFQGRFAAVETYLAGRPGTVGIVVRDGATGALWSNGHAEDLTWTASTIKLAMVVDLFVRERERKLRLSDADRRAIDAMLHTSDDESATMLWSKFGGRDHLAFNNAFPAFGMTSLKPQPGFGKMFPYWGFQKCTAADLERLMRYVLTELPAAERSAIVDRMRGVGPNQQWGLWAAGTAARPGVKAGWSDEEGGAVMNSVGFVGPEERYTVAIMNNLAGRGGQEDGRTTVSEVARMLFDGRF